MRQQIDERMEVRRGGRLARIRQFIEDEGGWLEFFKSCGWFILFLIVLLPIMLFDDTKDWTVDRWKHPWRVQVWHPKTASSTYIVDGSGCSPKDMHWRDLKGFATLDEAMRYAVSLKRESITRIKNRKHIIMTDILRRPDIS